MAGIRKKASRKDKVARHQAIVKKLQDAVDLMGDRMNRVPESYWLFVFGPRSVCADHPFEAFTVVDSKVSKLPDDKHLIPNDWRSE